MRGTVAVSIRSLVRVTTWFVSTICPKRAKDYHGDMSGVAEIKIAADGLVVSNPAILRGTPIFRGARLPIQTLFDYLADGLSLNYFLETFEGVSREHAQGVLRSGCARIVLELRHEDSA